MGEGLRLPPRKPSSWLSPALNTKTPKGVFVLSARGGSRTRMPFDGRF